MHLFATMSLTIPFYNTFLQFRSELLETKPNKDRISALSFHQFVSHWQVLMQAIQASEPVA